MKIPVSTVLQSVFTKGLAAGIGLMVVLAGPQTSHAASATWNGTGDGIWSNANNWSGATVPGVNDTATFSNAGNNNTNIDLTTGVGVTVSNIVFDTASAAAYTIGTGGVGSQMLILPMNGAITVNSAVTKPQLINANLSLGTDGAAGPYNLANNSGQSLTIAGGILGAAGGTAGSKVLFIGGSGNTAISGNLSNGGGTLTLTKVGAGTLTQSGTFFGTGSIVVSNGTLNLTGLFNPIGAVGNLGAGAPNGTAPIGVINISSNVLLTGGGENLFVGNYPNSLGVVNQTAGAITIGQNLKMGSDNANTSTNYGFYNMTGGSMTMNNLNRWRIGQAQGTGGSGGSAFLFYLSGTGSITLNALSIGLNDNANPGVSPANHSVLYIAAGTITAGAPGASGANGVSLGIGGKGGLSTNIVTISGTGSVSLNGMTGFGRSAAGSTSGNNASRVAILNLNGNGFLQTAQLFLDGSQSPLGYLNFNGGRLMAQTNNANFLNGLNQATVYGGGLTIDDNGAAITIGQALLAPTGSGVVSIAVSGATGYTGAPYVEIAGGNPTTPATAVADWNGSGTISHITITDPGTGYTGVPVVRLVGGGGTPGALTATLGTSGSGGLIKNGSGTLTLSGANTFTGLTTVANGSLMLRGGSLGGPVTVGSGLTFGGDGTISGSVALASGVSLNLSNGVAGGLTIGNGLTLNGGAINFELGSAGSSDKIALTGGSLSVNGTVTINLSAIAGFNAGNYNLISGGGLASTNGFVLGATPDPTFTYSLTNSSGNLLVRISTTNATLTAFWRGDVDGNWNTTSPTFNWSTDIAGTNHTAFLPSQPTDVTFATINAANFATTLGADFEINSLTFSIANGVSVSGANLLQIDNGLMINPPAGAVTINSPVALGFSQVWSNNSANPFTINSGIGGSSVSLTFAGTGTTTLNGHNTFSGGTTVSGGTLKLSNPTDTLADNGAVTINNATLDLGGNNDTVGPVILISGTITSTVGVLSGSSYEVQSGSVKAILGGAGGLTKTTSGTVTLDATNFYTGSTLVKDGTLVVTTSGAVSNTAFSSVGRSGNDNGTLTLQGNASYSVVGADFNIGDNDASKGTLNVSNNATVVASHLFMGSAFNAGSSAQGIVNQSGGSVTTLGGDSPSFVVGGRTNLTGNSGSGTYNISGGSLLVANGGNAWIGGWGRGAMNVTGGGVTFSNFLSVGRQRSPTLIQPVPVGTLTVSGGSVTQANPAAHLVVGELGTGTLVVAGSGLMVVRGTDGLIIGNGPDGYGTVNLNGGTLMVTNVNQNLGGTNGTSVFNFNGGTLKAIGSHPNFMAGLSAATVQAGGGVIDDNGFALTIGQPLLNGGGAGGLTKLGSGSVTLTGTNTYQGPTTVNAGRLTVSAAQTSTGAVTVADSATLRVTAANSSQWSPVSLTVGTTSGGTIEFNAISSTTVAPLNVGTFTLNGIDRLKVISGSLVTSNSYPLIRYSTRTGGGTYTFSPPGGMTATLSTNSNTLFLNVQNFGVQLWKGNVNGNWDIEITTNWTVNAVPSAYGDGGMVQFDDTATATSVNILSEVLPASVIFSNSAKTYTFNGAAISGLGTLTKMGSGLVVMGNTNTYNGDTTIISGTFRLAGDNVIPGGSGNGSVLVNGTLDLAGHSNTLNGLSGSGVVDSSAGGVAVLVVGTDGSSSAFSGTVQNTSGTLALIKTGAGAFTLAGNNTHSGGTTLSAGQLNINNAGALGAASSVFTINGGTMDNTTSNAITVANNNPQVWNGDFTYAGSVTNLNLGTGAVSKPGNLQVTVNGNNLTVGGVISGSGSLNKAGAGTLTLLGNNNFGGNLNIVNGAVAVTTIGDDYSSGGTGAGSAVTLGSAAGAGVLSYIGSGESNYRTLRLNSGGNGILDMSGTGALTLNGDFFVDGATARTLTLQGSGPGTGEVASVIGFNNATNNTSIAKGGTGVWMLSGANTYTGDTSIKTGALVVASIGNPGVAGSNLGAGTNIILGSIGATGTLVYVGSGETTSKRIGLTASGTGGGIIDQSGSGLLKFTADLSGQQAFDKSITLQGSATGSGEFAGAITEFGSNRYSVIKLGTGLWALSATNNSYTGATVVNSGTLAIIGSGTISNSATITVASGATLDVSGRAGGGMTFVTGQTLAGAGTVVGTVTMANGATLSPGVSSPGVLTVMGSLVLNDSSILAYDLGIASDQIAVNGNLTLDGVLNVTDSGGLAAGNKTLITYTGALVNNTLTVGTMPSGFSGSLSNDTVNKRVLLVVSTAAVDSYASWATHYGLSGPGAAGGADPDGDGLSNTNEFLTGFSPTNNAAYPHIISLTKSGGNIVITYLGANGDNTWSPGIASRTNVLEFTTGAGNGGYTNSFQSTVQTNILGGGTGVGVVTSFVETNAAAGATRYYRVRVLAP
jgi:fibronectin-binding autotransporter adhesin